MDPSLVRITRLRSRGCKSEGEVMNGELSKYNAEKWREAREHRVLVPAEATDMHCGSRWDLSVHGWKSLHLQNSNNKIYLQYFRMNGWATNIKRKPIWQYDQHCKSPLILQHKDTLHPHIYYQTHNTRHTVKSSWVSGNTTPYGSTASNQRCL
jgi:hypothetical protein